MKTIGLFDENGELLRLRDVADDYNEELWFVIPDGLLRPVLVNGNVVEGATSEELAEWRKQIKLDQIEKFRKQMRDLGQEFYNSIDVEVTADLYGKPASIVNPAVEQIDERIMPIMNLIKDGQWYSALVLAQKTQEPDNEIALSIWNRVLLEIQNIIQTYYQ